MSLRLGMGGGGGGARTYAELLALPTTFRSTWNTANTSSGSSTSTQVALPLVSGGTYDMLVDWGDGTADQITAWNQAEVTHTYASGGVKNISIVGTCTGFQFDNGLDKLKLTAITNGGGLRFLDGGGYFYGCTNLTSLPSDLNLTGVTNVTNAWFNCTSLTSFPAINFSSIDNVTNAWFNCTSLTSFPALDLSAVTLAIAAWKQCTGLTSFPLLDTSALTNASGAWYNCSGLTSFPTLDLSSVTNASSAWFTCGGLTSFPLLDLSSATNISLSWYSINFDSFPVGFGSSLGAVTNATNALAATTLTTAAYDRLLVEINAANSNTGVAFHGGAATYTAAGAGGTARAALVLKGWTITDGGAA